ncbi:type I-E CRISPR-associated protein Cse2/CasB [Streptomyces antimycoticus]|uniref:type I-E CRISPR-associated protein Cse2/CasB n=1 Tax=Streptomyces antimycoticus TaxID=68175 RepID=UPI0033EB1862|nr:type I-E CRISPR-associated protein Cse2/CasB [Streptomyces antimycoticus]
MSHADEGLDEYPAELAQIIAGAPPADERPPAERLNAWLRGLVHSHEYGTLADLRRLTVPRRSRSRRSAPNQARLLAANFAPQEHQRAIYEGVAFLFARYHAGATRPRAAYGDMGHALRKVGSVAGHGPKDPGATRLLDRLAAARDIPWRHLQHAVERMRAGDTAPPSWVQLADDLTDWKSRDRDVPETWARSFYTPTFDKKNGNFV